MSGKLQINLPQTRTNTATREVVESDDVSDLSSDDECTTRKDYDKDEYDDVVFSKRSKKKEAETESEDPLSNVLARFFSVRLGETTKSIAQILEEINQKLKK